jgi:hypothetical protein
MKKYFSYVATTVVLMAVTVAIFFTGREALRSFSQWRFKSHVCEYNRQTERDSAWAGFHLAKSKLATWEVQAYEKRMEKLEREYQHRYASALAFVLDPTPITEREIDSFDSILVDISFRLSREESPGKEVWELCEAQGKISGINWPFVCEGISNADGSVSEVGYEEYLDLKEQFGPAKERMETLLAKHDKK